MRKGFGYARGRKRKVDCNAVYKLFDEGPWWPLLSGKRLAIVSRHAEALAARLVDPEFVRATGGGDVTWSVVTALGCTPVSEAKRTHCPRTCDELFAADWDLLLCATGSLSAILCEQARKAARKAIDIGALEACRFRPVERSQHRVTPTGREFRCRQNKQGASLDARPAFYIISSDCGKRSSSRYSIESGMDHGTRRHSVVAEILADLFEGEFAASERMRVEHLASRYGVSVTPVREALVELAGLGLVELKPNRGAAVRPFSPRQVREICHLRRVLECEATRCATGRIAPFELAALENELKRLVKAARSPQWSAETRRLDSALHELIAERCGNEQLAHEIGRYSILYRVLRDARHRRRAARSNYAQFEENSEHLKIVQALASGNAELAAEAMSVHINQAAEVLVQDLFGKKEIKVDSTESFLQTVQAAG